jgi:hypothetical protein
MATALHVDVFDDAGELVVRHSFFGASLADAEGARDDYMLECAHFRYAEEEGRTGEVEEEIDLDDIPQESDYEEEEDPEGADEQD